MRFLFVVFACSISSLYAQDPGSVLGQQTQQAGIDAVSSDQRLPAPSFSFHTGAYSGPIILTMKSSRWLRHARIFYTIGDWTPTERSTLYTGPIVVDRSETIRAVTILSRNPPGYVRAATYTLSAVPASPAPLPLASNLTIPAGTRVNLAFAASFDSGTAVSGQRVPLVLADDLVLDGRLVAPQGSAAQGTLTQIKQARSFERPGSLSFRVDALQLPGHTIALRGEEVKEGPPLPLKNNLGLLIPVVGGATILQHGAEAQIPVGARLAATVATDTTLAPPAP